MVSRMVTGDGPGGVGIDPRRTWKVLALRGVVSILFGILALARPGITVLALALLAGGWAVMSGVAEVAAAIRLRKQIGGEALLAIAGIVSIIAGGSSSSPDRRPGFWPLPSSSASTP